MSIVPPEPGSKTVTPRKAISRRLRFEILRRDNHTCRYCHATDTPLTIDHVIPVALGGTDDPSNLVAACKDCNAGKSSSTPDAAMVAQVDDDAIRWAAAMQEAADKAAERIAEAHAYSAEFDKFWARWWYGDEKKPIPRDFGWSNSVRRWHDLGLPLPVLVDAAATALSNDRIPAGETWRYFCGIAWKKVRELQDDAAALLATEETPAAAQKDPLAAAFWDGYTSCTREHEVAVGAHQVAWLSRVVDGPKHLLVGS